VVLEIFIKYKGNNGFKIISIDEKEVFGENEYTFYFEVVVQKVS